MLAYAGLAAICGAILALIAAADWLAQRRRPTPPIEYTVDLYLPPLIDDWRACHIIWSAPSSLLNDPHGPARCRCAACQAKRERTR